MSGVVFLGTSAFAVPSLRRLVSAGELVSLVVTQPDRPSGRGRRPEPSPVKSAAADLSLPVYQPQFVNSPDSVAALRALDPEFLFVVAYGQILRRPVLEIPSRGALNLHPSLLPRHRGPSPIAWSILEGDREAGNTTMMMDEGLDSGPILLQRAVPLPPEATRGDMEALLAEMGAELVVDTLNALRRGQIAPRAQEEASASWSRLITRELRAVDWRRPAHEVRRRIHALSPTPGAVARVGGRLIRLLRVAEVPVGGTEGQVLSLEREGPVVGCGKRAVVLREVQPEGRRVMSGADFARGGGVGPGVVLEAPWEEG